MPGGHHGVLILHRRLTAARRERPAVAGLVDPVGAQRQEGFQGEDQALSDAAALGGVAPGCDFCGSLVQRAADAVAREVLHQAVAVLAREGLDALAGRVQRGAGPYGPDAGPERAASVAAEALDAGSDPRYGETRAGVAEDAVDLGGDVDIDQVAGGDLAVAGDTVSHVGADGDAGGAREAVSQFRGRAGARQLQEAPADAIQLPGGDPGLQGLAHGLERTRDEAPCDLQPFQLVFAADGHEKEPLKGASFRCLPSIDFTDDGSLRARASQGAAPGRPLGGAPLARP